MMAYKGYTAKIEFDNDTGLFHGQVLHTRDVITFQETSVDELRAAFADSIDDYVEFCAAVARSRRSPSRVAFSCEWTQRFIDRSPSPRRTRRKA